MVTNPLAPSFLEIKNITHLYGQKPALQNVSLEAHKSEVLALLGPSGSGKSTLLAVIAGIVQSSAGKVLINGRNLLDLPPEFRGLGMVFQDFALWPHMTVFENVGFPLRVRKTAPGEIKLRAEDALQRVGLTGFESRRPHQLSGGQQQRVALARAVVAEAQLLLLDEPLSALDPATRSTVRSELCEILRKLDLTTIIVTHDREEAFELADRIAVLVDGQIQQHAIPEEVYERPANLTVARFMGANILKARILSEGSAELNDGAHTRLKLNPSNCKGPVHLTIVPEKTLVVDNPSGVANVVPARLLRSQYRGGEYRLQVKIGDRETGQIVEARSRDKPRGDWLSVCLSIEAIHVIQEWTAGAPLTAASQIVTNCQLTKLQEEIA
ncbi:MAG TPA: ABC transporter ATP-binding protein [Candidatus Limnocylindrales bacterium]|nr:ABC transporter ATP-binding protein [Candidatus Limnocylindrales bacterium]